MSCNNQYYITAYGLAVKHGFKGSIEEWLESLNGYIHIKYSEEMPASDSDMQDEPADWMGVYTGRTAAPSTSYKDYKWHYVKGVTNAAIIAPIHSTSKTYHRGDIISYGERVMRCTADTAYGSFNVGDWESTTLSEALEDKGLSTGVSYAPQELTEEQREQARFNIMALSLNEGAVGELNLADPCITADKIFPGEVKREAIGRGAVNGDKLDDLSVDTRHIVLGAVDTDRLATGAVKSDKIYAGAVTPDKLSGLIPGSKLNLYNNDLSKIILTKGKHYFDSIDQLPASPATGQLAFVKVDE